MKPYVFGAVILMLAGCPSVSASGGSSDIDWGTKVEITGVTWKGQSTILTDPAKKTVLLEDASLETPMNAFFTPDGRSIVYTDKMTGIWKVPVEGGTPEVVFDAIYLYPYNDFYCAVKQLNILPRGFSRDGRYLFFSYQKFDQARGASITINPGTTKNGGGFSVDRPFACETVVRLDMETGDIKEIAAGFTLAAVSKSGEILCWYSRNGVEVKTFFHNLVSGKTWEAPVAIEVGCFTPDGSAMIYNGSDSKFYRISIDGGEPELLSANVTGDISGKGYPYDCSPDGSWVLYTTIDRLCLFNLNTRKTVGVFPSDTTLYLLHAWFSSDGTRFCYIRYEKFASSHYNKSQVYTHEFDTAKYGDTELAVNESVPAPFEFSGNHPNPFNPSTAISFSLEKAGTVELAIYDITGRKVRDLANGHMAPGRHEAVWNGRDDRGMPAASGVYFARLVSGGTTLSHRMLLMK